MVKITELRSAVLTQVTMGRPLHDLGYSDLLLDYYIFAAADLTRFERRRSVRIGFDRFEPWMYSTVFASPELIPQDDQIGIRTDHPIRYRLDMPFEFANVQDRNAIESIRVLQQAINFRQIGLERIGYLDSLDPPVSASMPAYYYLNNSIYFLGGKRDYSKLKLIIRALAGSSINPSKEKVCSIDQETIVGVPESMKMRIIEVASKMLLEGLIAGKHDLGSDGKFESNKAQ